MTSQGETTNGPEEPTGVLEMVSYRLAPGITRQEHLDAAGATQRFLAAQPGFVRRVLTELDGGEWRDVVEWTSRDAALEAAEKLMHEPAVAPFIKSLDPQSIDMQHGAIVNGQF